MVLREIPRESRIRVTTTRGKETITFHRTDGMYSYCTADDGEVLHLGVMQPLKLADDGIYDLS